MTTNLWPQLVATLTHLSTEAESRRTTQRISWRSTLAASGRRRS